MGRRKRRWLWSIIALIVFPSSIYCTTDNIKRQNDINKYITRILSAKQTPTYSDYYEFYGASEVYGDFLLKFCEEEGFNPSFSDPKCSKYTWNGELHNKAVFQYFDWLRSNLPLSPKKILVQQIDYIEDGKSIFDYELVTTTIDDVSVVFFRPIPHPQGSNRGLIRIYKINGILVEELIKKELSLSIKPPTNIPNTTGTLKTK
jgi:hypothetical protein